jgi:cell division transport system ATP-binding protein
MIPQTPTFLLNKTVFENVAMPLVIAGYREHEVAGLVRAALEKVGLLHKESYFPNALSAGEQQRIGIARAVVHKPKIILADEPTGNLDPALSAEIMKVFERFNEMGTTMLLATHDLDLVSRMQHRILTLQEGRLIGG